ncbi:MFS transporter [Streptomyces wuyuanensis]|uniref:MFS transporter n=1 Tax=Streptomyces wuyuanensis TaxID=1196353 RepID=UPI00342F2BC7
MPAIGRSLAIANSELHWVVTAALLPMAALSIISGRLGDVIGGRRVLIFGMLLFGVASAVCGLAPDGVVLIAGRAFQGIGCALAVPLTLSNLAQAFPKTALGWAVGLVTTATTIGTTVFPLLTALIVDHFGWRLVFFINVPLALLVTVAVRRVVPDTPRENKRLDIWGCVLLGCALFLLVFAFERWSDWGIASYSTALPIGVAIAALCLFVYVEKRHPDPLLDLRALKNRRVMAALAALALVQCCSLSVSVNAQLFLQHVMGNEAFIAALILLAASAGPIVGAPYSGRIVDRGRGHWAVTGGMVAGALGLVSLFLAVSRNEDLWMIPGLLVFGFAPGFVYTTSSVMTLSAISGEERGVAAGLTVEARQVGATIGFSLTYALFTATQNSERNARLGSQGVTAPQDKMDAVLTDSSEGQDFLNSLPADVEGLVTDSVNRAFVVGFGTTLLVMASLLLLGALVSIVALRPGRTAVPTV